jgi:hypothetical protein
VLVPSKTLGLAIPISTSAKTAICFLSNFPHLEKEGLQEASNFFLCTMSGLASVKTRGSSLTTFSRTLIGSLIVTSEYSALSYSSRRFCLLSVKQLGKKSGKTLWIAPKTRTCPTGDSGINRIMTTGINVTKSLKVRLYKNLRGIRQGKDNDCSDV